MNVKIDVTRLRGARVFVGSPMYDGQCRAEFTFAMCQLSALCTQVGIELQIFFASGEALVMKARNAIADKFMRSDCTHLMLIDADIGFSALDVLTLLDLQLRDAGANEFDVVAAAYSKKRLAWDTVAAAARRGLVGADAGDLRHYAAELPIFPVHPGRFDISAPVEVTQVGTGFMMIRRSTFDAFQTSYPTRRYVSDGTGIEFGGSETIAQFFDAVIEGHAESLGEDLQTFIRENSDAGRHEILAFLTRRDGIIGQYVSEDYMFCHLVRRIGRKVWICPWMELVHIGSHVFESRFASLARLVPND